MSRLETANHKLAETMYRSTAQPGPEQPPTPQADQAGDGQTQGETPPREGVIDAEYVVDDKKN